MTTIKLKNGSGAPLAGDLVVGEPALDLTNKRLYTEDSGGTVIEVGTNPSTINIDAGTIDGTVIGGSTAAAGSFTTFTSTGIDDNAASTAITIDGSQNVGIGTSSPSNAVTVNSTAGAGIKVYGADQAHSRIAIDNLNGQEWNLVAGTAGASNSGFGIYDADAGSTRLQIDSSGNVGIGTTSPALSIGSVSGTVLHAAGAGTTGARFQNTSGTSIEFFAGSDAVINTATSTNLVFQKAGSETMRIDASSNLLVGKTSLDVGVVGQELRSSGFMAATRDGSTVGAYTRLNSDGTILEFRKDGSAVGSIGAKDGNLFIGTGDTGVRFSSGTDSIFPIDTSTGNGRDASIDLGLGAGGRFKDLYLSGNVQMGGNLDVVGQISSYDNVGASYGTMNFRAADFVYKNAGGTERMRIDASGNLLLGTTSAGAASSCRMASSPTNTSVGVLRVDSTLASDQTYAAASFVKKSNDSTTNQVFIRFGIAQYNSGCGQINANGVSQAAFGANSDRRLKENITDLPNQLANITALRPVEFDYIESEGGGHQIGFIAQEVEEIYPDLVGERHDGMKTLTGINKMEARLIKALQEQNELINDLRARVAQLEGAN